MKLNKIMLAAVMAFGVSSLAHAAVKDQGHGKVTFSGSIIDAPCSIAPESIDQTVELGAISNVALKDGGKSMPRPFQIKLENCDLTVDANDPSKNNNKVSLTFTGSASEADSALLGITGTAKGAGIALTDGNGKNITLARQPMRAFCRMVLTPSASLPICKVAARPGRKLFRVNSSLLLTLPWLTSNSFTQRNTYDYQHAGQPACYLQESVISREK